MYNAVSRKWYVFNAKNAKLAEQKAGSAHLTDGNETSVVRKEYHYG